MSAKNPPCPICKARAIGVFAQAKDIEYCTSDRKFEFYNCEACGVLFIDPMLSDELDTIYPKNYYSFKKTKKNLVVFLKEWIDQRSLALLTRNLQGASLSVLDIGGGTGFLLDQVKLADDRVRYTAVVDIDSGAELLARNNGHEFFLSRFEEFDAKGKTFDLILMLNLIEHVVDPRAILEKAASLLTPAGIIWVKTPNFSSLDARLFRHQSWGGYHTPRHFIIFNQESLSDIAENSGLVVTDFSYTQGAPFWSVSILHALQRHGFVSISAERPAIYHPLMPFLQAFSAIFDFCRKPFGAKLSQMVVTLKRRQ